MELKEDAQSNKKNSTLENNETLSTWKPISQFIHYNQEVNPGGIFSYLFECINLLTCQHINVFQTSEIKVRSKIWCHLQTKIFCVEI
jgi:hypothetical protein